MQDAVTRLVWDETKETPYERNRGGKSINVYITAAKMLGSPREPEPLSITANAVHRASAGVESTDTTRHARSDNLHGIASNIKPLHRVASPITST